ncbi:MAG: alanine--glyoxylate aminotransferase family protein [Dehalococcoidia bacterium]
MNDQNYNLRIPGPTPVPQEVLQAAAGQMINHRGPDFKELIGRITARLKGFFQTENDLLVFTSSGTGAMEASIVNTLSPGDRVLAIIIGAFGERYAAIARALGAEVVPLSFPFGQAADPDQVRKALEQDITIKAVLVTHNETSTGVTNDLASISRAVREYDRLLLVDAISSIGSIDLPVDSWGCDVVATASQKGWMAPPGLAMVSISKRAWEANTEARMPRYYFDFSTAMTSLQKGETPWTPGLSVFYALDTSLQLMEREGLANVIERHAAVARRTREGIKALGLSLLAREEWASNTVTAIKAPEGLDVKELLRVMREEHGVVLAGGPGPLAGKVFRIGHLGYVNERDIDGVLASLRPTLERLGFTGERPARATV